MLQILDPKSKATLLGRLFERHNVKLSRKEQLEYTAMLEGARNWPHLVAEREQLGQPTAVSVEAAPKSPVAARAGATVEVDPNSRYLVSDGWGHCFVGSKETLLRFVFDRQTDNFVACDAFVGGRWEACHRSERADLRESLEDNNVFENPQDSGCVEEVAEVPEW